MGLRGTLLLSEILGSLLAAPVSSLLSVLIGSVAESYLEPGNLTFGLGPVFPVSLSTIPDALAAFLSFNLSLGAFSGIAAKDPGSAAGGVNKLPKNLL